MIQNATLKKEVENICEGNSHAELNKKIQNERIKGKDEFPELMKDRTVQSQEEQFQAGEYYMDI